MPRIAASVAQNIKSPKRVADKVELKVGKDDDNCIGVDKCITNATNINSTTTTTTTTTKAAATAPTTTNICNEVRNFMPNQTPKKSIQNSITPINITLSTIATTTTTTTTTLTTLTTIATATTASATRTMQSDEDFNIRFVNLVRFHKCLYDKKVPEYRNRDNQEKAWLQISQETKESVIHCKERWRNLRACLSRYIKQQSSTDPQHKPYYLTEHMAFLLPFLKSTRNSLDSNSNLAALFQYSQQQSQQEQCNSMNDVIAGPSATVQIVSPEVKHSISENEDEETMDAFDPAITADIESNHNYHHNNHHHQYYEPNNYNRSICSPTLSDTASANSLQPFIPDVQLSELQTMDNVQQQQQQQQQQEHVATYGNDNMAIIDNNNNNNNDYIHHNHHLRNDSLDHRHRHHQHHQHHQYQHHTPEPKRIKTECQTNEVITIPTTTVATQATHATQATEAIATISTASNISHNQHFYANEQADMEFFRSILPDIAGLTPQQKRKLKIGILELIDDVVERFPNNGCNVHVPTTANACNNSNTISYNNNESIGSIVNSSNGNVMIPSTLSASATMAALTTTLTTTTATSIAAAPAITTLPISSQYVTRRRNSMREYHPNNHQHYQYRYHHHHNYNHHYNCHNHNNNH